jgi:hypothetical protein
MPSRSSTNPTDRFTELAGLKAILREIRDRLATLGVPDGVKHLAIVDIALRRALIDIEAEMLRTVGNDEDGPIAAAGARSRE